VIAHASPLQHATLMCVAVVATALYGRVWLVGRSSTRRLWCWAGGIAALLSSLTPRVETIADRSFTGHMIQHMVMVALAAPLLVLAHPLQTLAPHGCLPARVRRFTHTMSRTWRHGAAIFAPALFVGMLVTTHLTGIYDAALHHQWMHDVEHAGYLVSACALWALMLAPGRRQALDRVAAVFAVIAGMAFLGVVLLTADRALIDTYAERWAGPDALVDQRIAAAIMWVTGMVMTVPLLIVTIWRWASLEQATAERREALERLRETPEPPTAS
jgi:putative membrane protein